MQSMPASTITHPLFNQVLVDPSCCPRPQIPIKWRIHSLHDVGHRQTWTLEALGKQMSDRRKALRGWQAERKHHCGDERTLLLPASLPACACVKHARRLPTRPINVRQSLGRSGVQALSVLQC